VVIYKPDTEPVSVARAIELLRNALPAEPAGEVFVSLKEDGSPNWDGPVEVKLNEKSTIRSAWLVDDFLSVCSELGIRPRNRYRPHITELSWNDESPQYFLIAHEDFVKYAGLYGVAVELGHGPAIETPGELSGTSAEGAERHPDWIAQARAEALSIIRRDKTRDLYPSQVLLAEEIARAFRKKGVVGPDGKPLAAATIKRHALKGITSSIGKQLSTSVSQGKRGG